MPEDDEATWAVDPDDEWGMAVIATVGRQLKLRREAAGTRAADFAAAMGYGEDLVRKVEGGKRIPGPGCLGKADRVLDAGGLVAAMRQDVATVRYPKNVRDLAKREEKAVELLLYDPLHVHGLLQTPEYARALFRMRRPMYAAEERERGVAAHGPEVGLRADPAPDFSFVQDEWALRRPLGGKEVLRGQLEHLLEVGRSPTVEIQVMPMNREEHAGVDGGIEVMKVEDGTPVGRSPGSGYGRPVSEPERLRILELR